MITSRNHGEPKRIVRLRKKECMVNALALGADEGRD